MTAFLTEGATDVTTNALDAVMDYVPKVINLAGECFNAIVGNPVLLFFFAVGLVGTGLGVFRKLKRTAKG